MAESMCLCGELCEYLAWVGKYVQSIEWYIQSGIYFVHRDRMCEAYAFCEMCIGCLNI